MPNVPRSKTSNSNNINPPKNRPIKTTNNSSLRSSIKQQTGGFCEPPDKQDEFQGVIDKFPQNNNNNNNINKPSKNSSARITNGNRREENNNNNDRRKEMEREPIDVHDDDSNDVLEITGDPSADDTFLMRKRSYSDLSASVQDDNPGAQQDLSI